MRYYKRFFAIILIALMAVAGAPKSEAGEKTIGLRIGYNTRNEAPIAGLFFQYQFKNHLRLAPNVEYYFKHKDTDGLSVNLNMHFPFSLGSGSHAAIYPLAGLNFTSWNFHKHGDIIDDINDVSSRVSRLGLNLGGGFEYYATSSLKLSLEAKATFIKKYTSGTFSLSIGYVF